MKEFKRPSKALHWITNVLIAMVFIASAGASENPFDQGLLGLYGLRIRLFILD